MPLKREFTVENAYVYDQRSPIRWLVSHVRRHLFFYLAGLFGWVGAFTAFSVIQRLIGYGAEQILEGTTTETLLKVGLAIMACTILDGTCSLLGGYALENLSSKVQRDARDELYQSLLAKSQVFHDRQRTGDLMARATEDMRGVGEMIVPGFMFTFDTIVGVTVPLLFILTIEWRLMLVPVLTVAVFIVLVRRYVRVLNPVVEKQRTQFGTMNAGLEETISGIEIVKASAQEAFERSKFRRNARLYRDYQVQQGKLEARYLPLLVFALALGLLFLHAITLYRWELVSIADIIAAMGLMGVLRFPVFISIFCWSLLENGVRSAERILNVIKEETDLDENASGYTGQLKGEIVFDKVSFGYEDGMILEDISFHIQPGQTVAIVGQTGSGKSTLTQLVNRTYDVTSGRILIDGVDVREWSLDSLRSQISKIEQDIFLFSRSIAENIAFGAPDTPQERIEAVARDAQAHEFIMSLGEGYKTKVGERGVMLSGGQRQRIALARAFLSNPRILILDDSTSAIDSATEDEIQKAIKKAQQGRTVLLITHRLSQIRWADHILVIDQGRLVAAGTHDQLLRKSPHYRRIFARYEVALPPLEGEETVKTDVRATQEIAAR